MLVYQNFFSKWYRPQNNDKIMEHWHLSNIVAKRIWRLYVHVICVDYHKTELSENVLVSQLVCNDDQKIEFYCIYMYIYHLFIEGYLVISKYILNSINVWNYCSTYYYCGLRFDFHIYILINWLAGLANFYLYMVVYCSYFETQRNT